MTRGTTARGAYDRSNFAYIGSAQAYLAKKILVDVSNFSSIVRKIASIGSLQPWFGRKILAEVSDFSSVGSRFSSIVRDPASLVTA